ncbi:hypothetical protein TSTA_073150 [Talaromyces stipitatus ATCC 10500]|uniref:Uncharacterized protein n=1 Tax=Talaromyces stipitatus (strain ATCC 10500 / CBS 375.48 / QM 6759 / NRRL 1006) TaxID=441959 RepID=B8LUR8_TALSN|nr:uncharacterized protein TSTA_073150 [Talaromyces stipitatus ATCC 10500]EED23925.1 hypothetical protein TSTA_073150 [Talaromyces stipitatus ATCC 10500]
MVPPPLKKPGKVILIFEDKEKAKAWERDMVLWEEDAKRGNVTNKPYLSLVTV